ncbi:MAG: hypothetical protein JXQ66_02875, partial [Campylobacterales bacterium]|nr:hypothetical protein [Campylobacterales bacterium]
DADIKQFFKNHLNTPLNIAIVPNQNCSMAMKKYAISKDIFEAIDDAFNEKLRSKIDILMCNEFITFNKIVIGDLDSMNQFLYKDMSIYAKVKKVFSNLKNIKFNKYTLTTSKEQQIQTVATAITVLEYDDIAKTENVLSIHDGKLNAFILAPTSLLSYIVYILSMFFYQKISLFSLPKSLGFIKASKLSISSNTPMDYKLDNDLLSAKEIELYVIQDGINLHLGKAFESKVKNDDIKVDEKDSIKVNSLPAGEMNEMLINRGLPLFKKAAEDQFRELFLSLRGSAKFSYVFLTLMILSTLLATTGLFANSAPVIIGAMILAPLMAPIVSLAMGGG